VANNPLEIRSGESTRVPLQIRRGAGLKPKAKQADLAIELVSMVGVTVDRGMRVFFMPPPGICGTHNSPKIL